MTTRWNSTALRNYRIINYSLIAALAVGLSFLLFSPVSPSCVYREALGVNCPSCGLTRDFKSILQRKDTPLINPASYYYFTAFSAVFISRLLSLLLIAFKTTRNWLITAEAIMITVIVCLLVIARLMAV